MDERAERVGGTSLRGGTQLARHPSERQERLMCVREGVTQYISHGHAIYRAMPMTMVGNGRTRRARAARSSCIL